MQRANSKESYNQCQAGPTCVSTHQVWGNSFAESPPPTGGSPAQKAARRNRDARTVPGTPWGHRKRRPRRDRPFSFVRVTHPPALPGRRVLHFELPAQGRRAAIFPRTQLVPSGGTRRRGWPGPARALRRQHPAAALRSPRPPRDPDERARAHRLSRSSAT